MKHTINENIGLIEGLLLVNKSHGKTSFSIVSYLRKALNIQKIGHCGTLDPFATGLMVMLVGRSYTKKSDDYLGHDKDYTTTLNLGATSTTYDCDGTVTKTPTEIIPTKKQVEDTLCQFEGWIDQLPPMYSAKKVKGQKLYKLARKGIEINRPLSRVYIKINQYDYSYPNIHLKITCSKGTYIRSLASDIGQSLKCGAYLSSLTRTRCGPFNLEEALPQDKILELDTTTLQKLLLK